MRTISNYLVTKNANMYAPTDKQFEVHRVDGTSEADGVTHTIYGRIIVDLMCLTGLKNNRAIRCLPLFI